MTVIHKYRSFVESSEKAHNSSLPQLLIASRKNCNAWVEPLTPRFSGADVGGLLPKNLRDRGYMVNCTRDPEGLQLHTYACPSSQSADIQYWR